ncbi:MAG: hypothetical protein ACFFED_12600 [Candidatus Thorarchaeota archaeon]
MERSKKVLQGAIGHIVLLVLNFFVLVGVIESFQIFSDALPILNGLLLGYMLIHTMLLLSVQLALQILELIRIRMPTFLISYYFQFDDSQTIPIRLLDPTKSKLAVLVLLLVISGGPILYPIFAIYGFLLSYAFLLAVPVDLVTYFEAFLNFMPPIMALVVGILIISIVAVEFKHL